MATDLKAWFGNWQRELEGAYLYGELAQLAKGASLRKALAQMADQEQSHSQVWADQVRSQVADAGA